MFRVSHHNGSRRRPLQGLGFTLSADSIARAAVDAIMPAVQDAMPSLIDSAWPTIEARLPGVIDSVVPQIESRLPAMAERMVPSITNKMLPALYAQLPEIKKRVTPMIKAEADAMMDKALRKYLGPTYVFRKWLPVVTLAGTALSLFASGIIIYEFWAGDR